MSLGKIHAILFATRGGEVIYERFYDRLTELDKAEIRAAFCLASNNIKVLTDDTDHIGMFRSARFVFIAFADIVIYLLSSGEYDELAAASIIRTVNSVLQEVLEKQPTAALIIEKYMKLCVIIDEVINEGILETTDREVIRRALKNKAVWE